MFSTFNKQRPASVFALLILATVFSNALALAADDNTAAANAANAAYRARIESMVDLSKPGGRGPQFFQWILDEHGREVKDVSDYVGVGKYSEGVASFTASHAPPVMIGNGYIDGDGKVVIPVTFYSSRRFSEGLAYVNDRPCGYIDHSGAFVFRNKDLFDGAEFSEGLAAVRLRVDASEKNDGRIGGERLPGRWGYVDKGGKIVIAPQYTHAEKFHQGLASVRLNKEWIFIDNQGRTVGDKYEAAGSFANGLAPVKVGGKWGFIDTAGKLVIAASFSGAAEFRDGLAAVADGEQWGFIDGKGSYIIDARYKQVRNFSAGLCAVQGDDGKFGFIDKSGKMVIASTFDDAEPLSDGLAMVTLDSLIGFVDASGKYVVPAKYDFGRTYSDNRTVVRCKNWNSYFMRAAKMEMHLKDMNVHKDPTSTTGVYIPLDFEDALKELDALLPEAAKSDIKVIANNDMSYYHHGLGMWLRNNWGLWKGQRLSQSMREKGFRHPDDMSGAILDSYWNKIHGQPYDLAVAAQKSIQYWDKMRPIVSLSANLPAAVKDSPLTMDSGETVKLSSFFSAPLTVLALCTKNDADSPKLIAAMNELAVLNAGKHVNLLAVSTSDVVGGTITSLGNINDLSSSTMAPAAASSNDGCKQGKVPGAFFRDISKLLDLQALVLPQTLLIDSNGVIVKRLNGFARDGKDNLARAIDDCLPVKPSP